MQMNQETVVEYQTEENTKVIQNAISIINANSNDRFTVKSRTSYETLIKTPIILYSHIRLFFPDDTIIDSYFSIKETIGDIVSFINQCLSDPNNEFVLSTTPPPVKYTNMKQTIQELKLYPKVLLYVNFSSEYNKLKENILTQIDIQQSFNSNITFNPNQNVSNTSIFD